MTKDEAEEFFAEIFCGRHHIPSPIKEHGSGWAITCYRNLATYDSDLLTRIVLLAHEKCFRVEITPCNFRLLRIIAHKRDRNDPKLYRRHPTIEQAIEGFRK